MSINRDHFRGLLSAPDVRESSEGRVLVANIVERYDLEVAFDVVVPYARIYGKEPNLVFGCVERDACVQQGNFDHIGSLMLTHARLFFLLNLLDKGTPCGLTALLS